MKQLTKVKTKKILGLLFSFSFVAFFLFLPNSCHAWWLWDGAVNSAKATIIAVIGGILQLAVWVMGVVITICVWGVVNIASYNNFIHETAIINAWVIVRDFANMFFVVVLLLIAFATILKQENYSAKKLLPKLIIMAILINFSRTICGIIIDLSQVVMLTFISAIGKSGGNYVNTLGVQRYFNMARDNIVSGETIELTSVLGGLIIGLIFLVISAVVLITILGILVIRMAMLWVYIVISPLAFMLLAMPKGEKYYNQWWSDFISNVVTGPILAFFLWLSLASASQIKVTEAGGTCFGPAGIACPDEFANFIVAIGMLIGGLTIASKMGGEAGKMAGKGSDWAKKTAKLPAVGAAILGGTAIDSIHAATGIDLNVSRVARGIGEKWKEKKAERYSAGLVKAGEVLAGEGGGLGKVWGVRGLYRGAALTGSPGTAWEMITSKHGAKQVFSASAWKKKREELKDELGQRQFEAQYMGSTPEKKAELAGNVDKEQVALETEKKELSDKKEQIEKTFQEKIDGVSSPAEKKLLEKEKKAEIETVITARGAEIDHRLKALAGFSKFAADNPESEESTSAQKWQAEHRLSETRKEMGKVTPVYDFEGRAADQKIVNEKASRIKDIKDGDELGRILEEAIGKRDKAMIKAISKKMAQNGDENEFLKKLAGNTGLVGMHKFVDLLINQAGFGKQEALALGSEISMTAKSTNHWGAAGAFKMENGEWRKASEEEQASFRAIEVGKMHAQRQCRDLNRLGYGYHDGDGKFHLDAGGVMSLKSLDTKQGHETILKDMNESAAKFIMEEEAKLQALYKEGVISDKLIDAIKTRAAQATKSDEYSSQFEKISDIIK